jgi:hypothetical protein
MDKQSRPLGRHARGGAAENLTLSMCAPKWSSNYASKETVKKCGAAAFVHGGKHGKPLI